jgi:hypothetical protein
LQPNQSDSFPLGKETDPRHSGTLFKTLKPEAVSEVEPRHKKQPVVEREVRSERRHNG